MKLLVTGITLFIFSIARAQNPVLPPGTKPGQLPAPKVRTLVQPDLFVTAIRFISLERDGDYAIVKVAVTIKNVGGLRVGETKLRGENAWARDGRPAGWKRMTESHTVVPIDPGSSNTAEYAFRVDGFTAAKKFAVKVFVDATSIVTESSESNNYSPNLMITPPAN